MPESNKPFVVTDRRKFTLDGELRPDAEQTSEPREQERLRPEPVQPTAAATPEPPASQPAATAPAGFRDEESIPAPTEEQSREARFAYEQTADRLDTAIRAADPGAEHAPAMNFEGLVQSLYLTAIMQLGGGTPEGERPRVDILGARQSIDMVAVLAEKTKGNLNPQETKLLESALFELRMAFLEITQALARSAAAKAGAPGGPGPGAPKSGLIV